METLSDMVEIVAVFVVEVLAVALYAAPTALCVAGVRRQSRALAWSGVGLAALQGLPGLLVATGSAWMWTAGLRGPATFGLLTLPATFLCVTAFLRVAYGVGRPRPAARIWLFVATALQLCVVVTTAQAVVGILLLPIHIKT